LHLQPLDVPVSYAIAAIYGQTAPNPTSPWVLPGTYTIKLIAEGKTYTQPLVVKMDPRVKTSPADLQKQFALSYTCYTALQKMNESKNQVQSLQAQLQKLIPAANGPLADSLKEIETQLQMFTGAGRQTSSTSLTGINNTATGLLNLLQESDMPVTSQLSKGVERLSEYYRQFTKDYEYFTGTRMKKLNGLLGAAKLETIHL
jgi:hypothetical protein